MSKGVVGCVVLACVVTATNASAQMVTNMAKRAGIGGSVGGIFTADDDVSAGLAFGVSAGLAPAPGFGPTLGFGWYQGDISLPLSSGGEAEVGRLRVRPLMAGVGYTWVNGRVATSASVNAGISFNSIRVNESIRAAFAPDVLVDVDNSFAIRPQFRIEYAAARKAGVYTSVGYFYTDLNAVLQMGPALFEDQWDASSVNVFVGVMVYPFR
jgi:hypothetical protein